MALELAKSIFKAFVFLNNTLVQERVQGDEIDPHSMPWLVDVSGSCTGAIIGSKHVLTCGHCHDTEDNIDDRQFVYVGTHEEEDESSGQKIKIIKVEGMDQLGHSVLYPQPEGYKTHLPDIEILTLENEVEFNDNVQKAILDSPSSDSGHCSYCSGDCSDQHIFKSSGWGYNGDGRYIMVPGVGVKNFY